MSPILGTLASQFSGKSFGSFESIATTTVGSGGQASIEFTSIPQTYTHLQIRGIGRGSLSGDAALHLRFNSDANSNYSRGRIYGENTSAGADGSQNNTEMTSGKTTNEANMFGATIIDILNYKNTNIYKSVKVLTGFNRNTGNCIVSLLSGTWRNTNAISSILLRLDDYGSGAVFQQYSQFALYGIKGV
jgi:hypothetical protein